MSENLTVSDALTGWIGDTRSSLEDLGRRVPFQDFVSGYISLLETAEGQLGDIESRLLELAGRTAEGKVAPQLLFPEYMKAMSVRLDDGSSQFLPSFSDTCLIDLAARAPSNIGLTPFRGLYACWSLGEIGRHFNRGEVKTGIEKLSALSQWLCSEHDKTRSSSTDRTPPMSYVDYWSQLRTRQVLAYDQQITYIKEAIWDVSIPRKKAWTDRGLAYACQTSLHFYLSGIRFYWNPIRSHPGRTYANDRYCVQSATSGLTIPTERYGFILPEGSSDDAAVALLKEIPPGSLTLDLHVDHPTEGDRTALPFFERWSYMVIDRARYFTEEILDLYYFARLHRSKRDRERYEKLAVLRFHALASKNPMRTVYFDSGIYRIAALAADPQTRAQFPKIQYCTTQRSRPSTKAPSTVAMLKDLLDRYHDGLELFRSSGNTFRVQELNTWTLVPVGDQLRPGCTYLWSNRDDASKPIAYGVEGSWSAPLEEKLVDARKLGYAAISAAALESAGTGIYEGAFRSVSPRDLLAPLFTVLLVSGSERIRARKNERKGHVARAHLVDDELAAVIADTAEYERIVRPGDWIG